MSFTDLIGACASWVISSPEGDLCWNTVTGLPSPPMVVELATLLGGGVGVGGGGWGGLYGY